MHLKRLEVKGFKSFADKIDLDFEKGITAIVGPNGSGKSNISDAIRWVMGEQSAKTLRGNKMEDIIFSGTENRKSLGCAEVLLTLDNSENMLPVDYSEVTIARRLYRSGESEYLINNNLCRLKDITELFMDTGIGRDGYSMIGQGKIDEILSAKSEDRRNVFEEAAGIVKYKTRKIEAEKKLQNTLGNLIRVNDIINELEEQITPLEKQSQVARRYLSLRDELKELEINFILKSYDAINNKLKKVCLDIDEMSDSEDEYENKKQEIVRAMEDLKGLLMTTENEYEKSNNSRFEMEKQLEKEQGVLKLIEERKENHFKDIERLKGEILEKNNQIHSINTQIKKVLENKNIIEEELKKRREILSGIEDEYSNINSTSIDIESRIENNKAELIQILKNISDRNNKINSIDLMLDSLKKRKSQLIHGMDMQEDTLNNLNSDMEKLIILKEEKNNKITLLKEELENISSIIKDLKSMNLSLINQRNASFERLKTLEARHKAFNDMDRDMEGFTKSVKAVINSFGSDSRVFGTIGDLIKVPDGYETAIEIALGASFQNIVVDSEDTAEMLINYLKSGNLGRATFLPLTTVKGRSIKLDGYVEKIDGFIGAASELVKYDDKFKNIISNLLGRIIICDDIKNARRIAKYFDYSIKIVTLSGDVINSGGSFTGGSLNIKNVGIFSRRKEIEVLWHKIENENSCLKELDDRIKNNETKEEEYRVKIEQLNYDKQNNEIDFQTCLAKINAIKKDIEGVRENIEDIKIELNQIELDFNSGIKIKEESHQLLNGLISEQSNIENELEKLQRQYKDYQISKERILKELTGEKIFVAETVKSLENVQNDFTRLSMELNEYNKKLEIYKAEIEQIEKRTIETGEKIEAGRSNIKNIEKGIEEIKKETEKVDEARAHIKNQISEKEKSLSEIDEKIDEIIRTIHKMEITKSKMEMEIEAASNKLWDDYELTIPQAEKYRSDVESMSASGKRVAELKNSIKELGDVNVNAIDEYKRVTERHHFLLIQRDDLIKAEESLNKIIVEITESMKNQFKEKFLIIKNNFNSTFKELFGGGYADLRLEDEDVLNSGIDIIVQPPGKKLQSLSLLSGGERGLCAIALVFAILKMKPTPFCVLDEIEASLDDANVNRFAKFLSSYSDKTQFIVITHRKGSMAVANELYGITMEEKGISKAVSLKLEGGSKNGMAG